MGWVADLYRPVVEWLVQRRYGFGHTMEVQICTDPHLYVAVGGSDNLVPDLPPHLDVDLRVWNTGHGPDVTIISVRLDAQELYDPHSFETVSLRLPKEGTVVPVQMRLHPKKQPLIVKPDDTFGVTLRLNNNIAKRIKAKVK